LLRSHGEGFERTVLPWRRFFFLPPIGTLRIADSHNWLVPFSFLFTTIVIRRLKASAHENTRKIENLDLTIQRMKEFGCWLLSVSFDRLTLSAIAEAAVRIFRLKYCSIHVHAKGKWHHFSGTSVGEPSQHFTENLRLRNDHQTNILELVEEEDLGVEYSQIRTESDSMAVLAIKSDSLSTDAVDSIASMIGILLSKTREARFQSKSENLTLIL